MLGMVSATSVNGKVQKCVMRRWQSEWYSSLTALPIPVLATRLAHSLCSLPVLLGHNTDLCPLLLCLLILSGLASWLALSLSTVSIASSASICNHRSHFVYHPTLDKKCPITRVPWEKRWHSAIHVMLAAAGGILSTNLYCHTFRWPMTLSKLCILYPLVDTSPDKPFWRLL